MGDTPDENSAQLDNQHIPGQSASLPNEIELVLLCLDYLRDLRRVYPPHVLRSVEGLDADYLTVACWALGRAFVSPSHMRRDSDPYFDKGSKHSIPPAESLRENLPTLATMESEIIYATSQGMRDGEDDQKKEEDDDWYEYDDSHPSNVFRFYALNGLASGPALKGALTLGEITTAGLASLGARSRLDAEKDMTQSPLFDQFLHAVQARGFFDPSSSPSIEQLEGEDVQSYQKRIYEDRYRKIVAKFRNKIAAKEENDTMADLVVHSAAEQLRQRRNLRIQQALNGRKEENNESHRADTRLQLNSKRAEYQDNQPIMSSSVLNPVDVQEAEKFKSMGNTHMQAKEFQEAANCYTQALKISPAGPHSHVYFSNRAAAMVSMKRFDEAIVDSERSLTLRPDYGKAHARLGLAHFLLGNYRQAMEAYTVALKYEPESKSSKNYLEKAAKRLAEPGENHNAPLSSSFSVVSEWDKSLNQKHNIAVSAPGEREAEKYKVIGNSCMAKREYAEALDAYSKAIQFCPNGSNSHVYFSNRAATLCYLERYSDAEKDSLQSLALNPNYGKAHARLGLSRFFLKDYAGAVSAYTTALKHDPANSASKSYLAKAKAKLEAENGARRLIDGSSSTATHKDVSSPNKDSFYQDPEMLRIAKLAANDPKLMANLTNK